MKDAQKPYWIRVLDHFQRKNYIANGLTIPFLIGARSKVYPIEPQYPIDEFLCQIMMSRYKVTIMTCPNIGHIVVGVMDIETQKVSNDAAYRNFGSIYITDDSFKNASSIDDVIRECKDLYAKVIKQENYSFENGRWSDYPDLDIKRLSEVSELAIIAMLEARENKTETTVDDILEKHLSGKLQAVIPLWHTSVRDICLTDQPDNLPAVRSYKGIEIVNDVNFELLLNNMFPERAADYRERELFHRLLDEMKIARIIDHWSKGEKLIPPTITFEKREDRNLFPAEGKHRLNVAYYYRVSQIPIVILTSERERILPLLNK